MRGLWLVTAALSVLGAAPAQAFAHEGHSDSTSTSSSAHAHESSASSSTGIWSTPSGRGLSTTFANGFWGGGLYGQEARAAFPLGTEHVRGQVRAQIVHKFGDPYRMDFGARLGIAGGSLALMNFVRAYGSGGIGILVPLAGPDGLEKKVRLGLSGEFGIEVFLTSGMGIFVEVGGGGYFSGDYANGGHAMAGMNFYPF